MIVKSKIKQCLNAENLNDALSIAPSGMCQISIQISRFEKFLDEARANLDADSDELKNLVKLRDMIKQAHDFLTNEKQIKKIKDLATEIAKDTTASDISKKMAKEVLEGLKLFALDYFAHCSAHSCCCDLAMKAPCKAKCPAHVDVPAYVGLAGEGDFAGAVKMVRKDNPFGTACALLCRHLMNLT